VVVEKLRGEVSRAVRYLHHVTKENGKWKAAVAEAIKERKDVHLKQEFVREDKISEWQSLPEQMHSPGVDLKEVEA
jgi:hypothetical protein